MNADADIRAALVSLLQGDAALNAQVNRVYDGEPAKATPPMLVVGDVLGSDWATKDKAGRELRLSLTVEDDRETPELDRSAGFRFGWLFSSVGSNSSSIWLAYSCSGSSSRSCSACVYEVPVSFSMMRPRTK